MLVEVRLVLAKRCEILIFLVAKRRMCEEKWIWRFVLNFCFFFFKKKENEKHKNEYVIENENIK